eukprot:CAMPEP_0116092234 /NCGR_PEP_ID=MMETSP0327-20121206/7934_1 /TAXON_ID=44447 /ORGANISM="Pseudo-nitzschia delicatissima, Strain B596" /LENGTH=261 /DNA_ID=CAMNT_0003583647 /DNA_START=1 /DNA_END=786 /DNA_ORIENTATION=+
MAKNQKHITIAENLKQILSLPFSIIIMGQDKVVLNIYELPMSTPENDQTRPYAGIASFFCRILPSAGFGAYHTSLDVGNSTYAYAVGGITKTSVANKHRNLPPQANFIESIDLGYVSSSTTDSSSDIARNIQKCLDYLREHFFTRTGYHLAYRNCNHFSETLATALISSKEDLVKKRSLNSYPSYINRLARTGSSVLDQSADKTEGTTGMCDVMKEARAAMGIGDKTKIPKKSKEKPKGKQKKELTEAQKKILSKIKSPKK